MKRLHSKAISKVNEIRKPSADVPPKVEKMKIAKPKNRTLDE